MKRWIAIVMTMMLAAALLVGCGGEVSSNVDESGSTEENDSTNEDGNNGEEVAEDITLEFWTISLSPTFDDFFNGLIAEYEEAHPGITINWSDLPIGEITTKLTTASAGEMAPDVVNLNTGYALNLGGKGALLNLNDYADDAMKKVYVESLWQSSQIGDAVYAFPWYTSPSILIYNTALFEEANMEVPTTLDEALDMAVDFYEATGAYLFNPSTVFYTLFMEGIDILNEDETAAAFNTTETYELLSKYAAVQEAGASGNVWGSWDNELQMFASGQLAIINSAASSLSRIEDEAPDVYANIGLASPLTGKTETVQNAVMNMVVPSASTYPEEAVELAAWLTSDEIQLRFCKEVEIFPSTVAASQDEYFKSDLESLNGQARAESAESNLMSEDFSFGTELNDSIMEKVNNIGSVIINGGDLQAAIDQAESDVNYLLKNQ